MRPPPHLRRPSAAGPLLASRHVYDAAGRNLARTFGTLPALDTAAPATPTGVSATANASNRITVSWTASTDNVAVTSYVIYRGGAQLSMVDGTSTSFADVSVSPNTAYAYVVVARDAAGNVSSVSSTANATTPSGGGGTTTVASDDFSGTGTLTGSAADVGGSWSTFTSVGTGSYGASVGSGVASLYHVSPTSGTRQVFYRLGTGTAADDLYVTDAVGGYDYSGDTGSQYGLGLFFRGSGANAYFVEASSSAVSLSRLTGGATSSITSSTAVGGSPVFGDQVRMHVQVSGSSPTTIRARAWKVGTTEPSTWAIDTTEGTAANQVAAGAFGIESLNFSATDENNWNNGDDFLVTTGSGGGGSDTTAPTTPGGLSATADGPTRVNLSWSASTDAVGVAGYKIYRNDAYLLTVGSTRWSDLLLSGSTGYTYTVAAVDAAGNTSSGSTTASATTAASSRTTTYTYDASGNRLTASDGTLLITTTYDRLNRVLAVDDEDPGTTADTTYTYSLTSPQWTDPTGTYAVTLDRFDRATVLDDPVNPSNFTWTYRADGQPSALGAPNGNTTAFGYDAVGRASARTTTGTGGVSRAAYGWTYNRAGSILSEQSNITSDPTNNSRGFAYDPLGRLTAFVDGATTTTYGFDAVLNRTSVQVSGGPSVPTTFDAANRPKNQNGVTNAYASDDDGRLIARPDAAGAPYQHFTWDTLGRLISVRDGAGTGTLAMYSYDPLDRLRVVDYGSNNRIRFRYAGLTTSAVQTINDATGTVIRNIGTGWGGELFEDWTGSGADLRIFGTNAHHDVTWTAGSTGTVTGTVRYDPWGTATSVTGSVPDFRFQSSWADDVTKLSWVITRWYAPAQGRFISEDSLTGEPRDPDSRHLYAYGAGDPVGAWDPDGMFWYKVRHGDTLWGLARRYLGSGSKWHQIYQANLSRIKNPRTIRVGQCIRIPAHGSSRCSLVGLPSTDTDPTPQPGPHPTQSCEQNPNQSFCKNPPPTSASDHVRSVGLCVAVAVGAGGGVAGQMCLIYDSHGSWASTKTIGGVLYFGIGGGGSVAVLLSTARSAKSQGGTFLDLAVSGKIGVGVSGVVSYGSSKEDGTIMNVEVGPSQGAGAGVMVGVSYTWVDMSPGAVASANKMIPGVADAKSAVRSIYSLRGIWDQLLGFA